MHGGKGPYDRPRPCAQLSKLIPLVSAVAVLAGLVLIAGPTAAETDSDGDGFTDAAEAFLGTDPLSACNATTTTNDEDIDAWPPDFNDDTEVDIADVALLRIVYGSRSGDGVYDPRFDLTADGNIDIADVVRLRGVIGSSCEPAPPPPPPPPPGTFLETFDGEPPTPAAGSFYSNPVWDVSIQSRFDKETVMEMPFVQMGPNCEPPPAVHFNDSYLGVVFVCRNHLMTGIRTGGYAAVYLTPGYMVDFSQGEAVIRFERSSLSTSNRDWTDFWITPFEDNLQFPLETFQAFLAGDPESAFHWKGRLFRIVRDFQSETLSGSTKTLDEILARNGLAPSPKRRDTWEVRMSRDHISVCVVSMPIENKCFLNGDIVPALTWDKGVVQFGHHSYNPTKGTTTHDCSLAGMEGICPDANTWHWDNVFIDPAVPFTIIHSDRRYVDNTTTDTVNFEAPAPANAFLRFMTMRNDVGSEVSFDGGQTWLSPRLQPSAKADVPANYWHPIPEGTTSVKVRAAPGNRGDWFAFDFRIWSETVPD
jgi:hypothetical protein